MQKVVVRLERRTTSPTSPQPYSHMTTQYTNVLVISSRGKGIPYGGSGVREDGGRNYGFQVLKNNPAAIDDLPEANENTPLRMVLEAVNSPDTDLFSVGCLSAPIQAESKFRRTGYVEFAINDSTAVADAAKLFPIFFHFDRLLKQQSSTLQIWFFWELAPATFVDAGIEGFTCAVTINTGMFATQDEADDAWAQGLALLAALLGSVRAPRDGRPIY